MDNQTQILYPWLTAALLSSFLFLGSSVLQTTHANPAPQAAQEQANNNRIQLVHSGHRHRHHRHHRHWRHGGWGVYFGPGYHRRGIYWTGWRTYYRHGRRCVRKCLVNRWTGQVIRCQRRCYR
ncbi:hypothetical protein [Legionella israelensis]|uniref:Uncharacterized protein n=1 Tax=Legionella israelensis TaxID=454 RepID=A0A0W0VL44_9GAMM|nr:hypothetical protein [Legionella israelensis]KTD20787.1 hypothetical protein Lisr_1686 [Legionella israelensis]QBS10981.1 hypothetical protein E4T55_14700 [Legionella israelensis]QDP72806.1 hypothetical protein FOG18_09655 [Legionella israelensis]SCY06140.1 hypothetical protein SAMN02746069_01144 [Legionella israelensis DSM 19235]STX57975.1 Uncharacterised protein [Legionella israelensis]